MMSESPDPAELIELAREFNQPDPDLHYDDDPAVRQRAAYDELLHSVAAKLLRTPDELTEQLETLEEEAHSVLTRNTMRGGVAAVSWLTHVWDRYLPEPLKDEGRIAADGIQKILAQKGFLMHGAVMTVAEHDEVGSTVPASYREHETDVPAHIVAGWLRNEGLLEPDKYDDEPISIEQADRARRLQGMTRLDLATGIVTQEDDPDAASDSYYFIAAGEVDALQQQEQEYVRELVGLYTRALESAQQSLGVISTLQDYIEGRASRLELNAHYEQLIVQAGFDIDLDPEIKDAQMLAVAQGSLDQILTPQEILLRAGGSVDEQYLRRPYTPVGLQSGLLTREQVAAQREAEGVIVQTIDLNNFGEMQFGISLEPLDEHDATTESPVFHEYYSLEPLDIDACREHFGNQITAPFTRTGDWYHSSA